MVKQTSAIHLVADEIRTAKPGCGLWLAQRAERRPDLGREQLGLFPGGEGAAPVDPVEVGDVRVRLLDPAARGTKDLAGERGEADRKLDLWTGLPGRASRGLCVLPV